MVFPGFMSGRLRALLIDDSPEDADLLERHLRDSGYALTLKRVDDPATLPQILAAEPWDVALCKYVMPAIARGPTLSRSCVRQLPISRPSPSQRRPTTTWRSR